MERSTVGRQVDYALRKLARGRSPWTGFLTVTATLVAIGTVAALLIAIALISYFAAR